MRPDAVEHFTSKHPVTKEELEGIHKFIGRGRSGRYLTIILEGKGTVYEIVKCGQAKRMRRLYIRKSRSDIDGKSEY
jgi:predicted metalloprotease